MTPSAQCGAFDLACATIPTLKCVGHDCVVPHSRVESRQGIRHGAAVPYKI